MPSSTAYDLVIYGATGFTGTLAAKYVSTQYSGGQIKWAVAGRSRSKLEALAAQVENTRNSDLALAHTRCAICLLHNVY